jgi:hypothetical protein
MNRYLKASGVLLLQTGVAGCMFRCAAVFVHERAIVRAGAKVAVEVHAAR